MDKQLQKLPVGVQFFNKLRKNNYLYVDKTKIILDLVNSGDTYFFSRPRRFGKSLLVSTLEELFSANKKLFKGLYIYDNWDWDESYPVIRIDMSTMAYRSSQQLQVSLDEFIAEKADLFNVSIKNESVPRKFAELILKITKKSSKKLVILIDEYDIPIIQNLDKDFLGEIKDTLHDFYQILKTYSDELHFVFLTGVSKFAGTSIFSGLNSPDDITLDERFSTICGYTQEELESNFSSFIDNYGIKMNYSHEEVLDKIKHWYNGYSWDGANFVYNPDSVLKFFRKNEFDNYWFSTGTPSFLIDLIKERNDVDLVFKENQASKNIADGYEIGGTVATIPLMFQTGYLTVKNKEIFIDEAIYTLDIPNNEVKKSIVDYLLNAFTNYPLTAANDLRIRMQKFLITENDEEIELSIKEMMAQIPYNLFIEKEKYFHSLFIIWIYLLSFDLIGEVKTNRGRMDVALKIPDKTFVIEIKYSKNENQLDNNLDKALKQINDKKYYEKYLSSKHLTLLAISYAGNEVKCKFVNIK